MNKLFIKSYVFFTTLVFSSIGSTYATDTIDYSYQVTGPVLALTDTSITVQKDKALWTILKDAKTFSTGGIKVGDKVAIKYHMMAENIATKTLPEK